MDNNEIDKQLRTLKFLSSFLLNYQNKTKPLKQFLITLNSESTEYGLFVKMDDFLEEYIVLPTQWQEPEGYIYIDNLEAVSCGMSNKECLERLIMEGRIAFHGEVISPVNCDCKKLINNYLDKLIEPKLFNYLDNLVVQYKYDETNKKADYMIFVIGQYITQTNKNNENNA